ncbi:MAG: RNA methyltransferase [bacterium]
MRRRTGRFLAEGDQVVREALRRPDTVIELFATTAAAARSPELLELAATHGVRVDEISAPAARGLSETVTPQGLVAVCRSLHVGLDRALRPGVRLAAALVGTSDPGNAGTVIRTADAAGADAVLLTRPAVDVYNGKTVRASAGSLFHLDVVTEASPDGAIAAARDAGLQVLATSGAAGAGASLPEDLDDLADAGALRGPTLWLFGNEAQGLPEDVITAADRRVRIPIHGRAESLNLAVAAAVCLYATARAQRSAGLNYV